MNNNFVNDALRDALIEKAQLQYIIDELLQEVEKLKAEAVFHDEVVGDLTKEIDKLKLGNSLSKLSEKIKPESEPEPVEMFRKRPILGNRILTPIRDD